MTRSLAAPTPKDGSTPGLGPFADPTLSFPAGHLWLYGFGRNRQSAASPGRRVFCSPCRNRYGNSGGGAKSRCHCLLPHPLTSRWRHARSAQRLAALPATPILDSELALTRLPLSDVMIEFMAQPHRGLLL